jgi:hypothetical protein
MNLAKALDLEKVTRFNDEINGEKFWFDAKDELMTPEFLNQLDNWDTDHLGCCKAMASIITDWDVEMDGEPFPPTAENFAKVPKKFSAHIINTIAASWQGNPQKPDESAST